MSPDCCNYTDTILNRFNTRVCLAGEAVRPLPAQHQRPTHPVPADTGHHCHMNVAATADPAAGTPKTSQLLQASPWTFGSEQTLPVLSVAGFGEAGLSPTLPGLPALHAMPALTALPKPGDHSGDRVCCVCHKPLVMSPYLTSLLKYRVHRKQNP